MSSNNNNVIVEEFEFDFDFTAEINNNNNNNTTSTRPPPKQQTPTISTPIPPKTSSISPFKPTIPSLKPSIPTLKPSPITIKQPTLPPGLTLRPSLPTMPINKPPTTIGTTKTQNNSIISPSFPALPPLTLQNKPSAFNQLNTFKPSIPQRPILPKMQATTTSTSLQSQSQSPSQPQSYTQNSVTQHNNNILTSASIQQPQFNLKKDIIFQLISVEQFSCADPNNNIIREVFNSIPDAICQPFDITSWWIFKVEYHALLCERIKKINYPNLTINLMRLPDHIVDKFCRKQPSPPKIDINFNELPPTLLPFQRKGIEFGIEKGGRCLIADDMGLGKTIQGISIAYHYRSEWPLLIIAPSSLRLVWADQIEKFFPTSIKSSEINLVMNGKCGLNGRINIISYDLVTKKKDQILKLGFQVVIADESHYIKQYTAQRSKSTIEVLKQAKRVILLSGTPALSRPAELYNQISCINPNFMWFKPYATRYCAAFQERYVFNTNGCSNMKELNLYLNTFMIRRLKDDVLTELPPKRRERILVKLDRTKLKEIEKTMMEIKDAKTVYEDPSSDNKTAFKSKGSRHGLFFKLLRDTGLYKLTAVTQFLKEKLVDAPVDQKFLIFAHHKEVLNGIVHMLSKIKVDKKKLEYIKIDGTTPPQNRNDYVNLFQTDENCRVAVLSITAAGTGLTLTAATCVIFAELSWTPGILFQAEDRAHRYGQTSSVLVQYLIGLGTVDEAIWQTIESKKSLLGRVLDDEESQSLNAEDAGQLDHGDVSVDSFIDGLIKKVEHQDQERKRKNDDRKRRKEEKERKLNGGIDDDNGLDSDNSDQDGDEEDDEYDEDLDDEIAGVLEDAEEFLDENSDIKKSKSKKPAAASSKNSKTKSTTVKKTKDTETKKKKTPTKSSSAPTKKAKTPINDDIFDDEDGDEFDPYKLKSSSLTIPKKASTQSFSSSPSSSSSSSSKKTKSTITSSAATKKNKIEVDFDEDFEELCHVDVNQFKNNEVSDGLDDFAFRAKD